MGKDIFGALHERGIRVTPQRVHVWKALLESGEHLTAEEIWGRVNAVLPGLELSTVYRTLDVLGGAGLVSDSRLPEGARVFEARAPSHPHLICAVCGEISHPAPEVEGRLLKNLEEAFEGFEVRQMHVIAQGVCARCAALDRRT